MPWVEVLAFAIVLEVWGGGSSMSVEGGEVDILSHIQCLQCSQQLLNLLQSRQAVEQGTAATTICSGRMYLAWGLKTH